MTFENIFNKKHSENADTSTSVTFDLELRYKVGKLTEIYEEKMGITSL